MDTRGKSDTEFRNEVIEILAHHESSFDQINTTLQLVLTKLQALRKHPQVPDMGDVNPFAVGEASKLAKRQSVTHTPQNPVPNSILQAIERLKKLNGEYKDYNTAPNSSSRSSCSKFSKVEISKREDAAVVPLPAKAKLMELPKTLKIAPKTTPNVAESKARAINKVVVKPKIGVIVEKKRATLVKARMIGAKPTNATNIAKMKSYITTQIWDPGGNIKAAMVDFFDLYFNLVGKVDFERGGLICAQPWAVMHMHTTHAKTNSLPIISITSPTHYLSISWFTSII